MRVLGLFLGWTSKGALLPFVLAAMSKLRSASRGNTQGDGSRTKTRGKRGETEEEAHPEAAGVRLRLGVDGDNETKQKKRQMAVDLEFPRTDDVDEDEHVPVMSSALGSGSWASRGEDGCVPLLA